MDTTTIRQHLALAERHVREGQQRVARQLRLMEELERDGHDIASARDLLHQFEMLQATFVADRDRVRGELVQAEHREGSNKR